jgi:hypothetical protein
MVKNVSHGRKREIMKRTTDPLKFEFSRDDIIISQMQFATQLLKYSNIAAVALLAARSSRPLSSYLWDDPQVRVVQSIKQ